MKHLFFLVFFPLKEAEKLSQPLAINGIVGTCFPKNVGRSQWPDKAANR